MKKFSIKNEDFTIKNEEFITLAENVLESYGLINNHNIMHFNMYYNLIGKEFSTKKTITFFTKNIDKALKAIQYLKNSLGLKDSGFSSNIRVRNERYSNRNYYSIRLSNEVEYKKSL